MKITRLSKALLHSPSLRTAAVMALGGVGFSVGSLLLARVLPTREYGLVALVLGIIAVGGLAAPLGLDQVAARRGIRLDAHWRRAALIACAATAVAVAAVAALIYHLSPAIGVSVSLITLTVGIAQLAGGHFQGRQRLRTAVWVVQLLNGSLILAALLALALGLDRASAVCALLAAIALLAAAGVWQLLRREGARGPQPSAWALRREAMPLFAVQTGNSAFLQLERLLIGPIVGLHGLAVYSVLAAFVSSPFRLLQAAVQFTLIPTLRVEGDARARRARLAREAGLVLIIVTAGSVAIWLFAPPLARWLVAGRYRLPHELIAATLVSGFLKVLSGFLTAVVVSCGEARRLRLLSLICWGSIVVGVAGALAGGHWGLVGVLYGIACGWLVRCVLAAWLALPHLNARERPGGLPEEVSLRPSPR
ncbi:MAG TPA: oligosaccharide flippase family protein [Steroidobacteraceae bacterium]|nr:oligosaccharide flippase family protein [Steroidobacteraceae bacterium]